MQRCIYDGCECLIRQYYKKDQATQRMIEIHNIIESNVGNDICSYFCEKHETVQDVLNHYSTNILNIIVFMHKQFALFDSTSSQYKFLLAIQIYDEYYYNSSILNKPIFSLKDVSLKKLLHFIEIDNHIYFALYYHCLTRRSADNVVFKDVNAQKIYDICKSMYDYETDTYNYEPSSLYEMYKIDNRFILLKPVTEILELYLKQINEYPKDEIIGFYKRLYNKDLEFNTFVIKHNKEIIKSGLTVSEFINLKYGNNDTPYKIKLLATLPYNDVIVYKDLVSDATAYENGSLEDIVRSKYPSIKICANDAVFDAPICGVLNDGAISVYKILPTLLENSYTSSFIYGPYYSSKNYANIGLFLLL